MYYRFTGQKFQVLLSLFVASKVRKVKCYDPATGELTDWPLVSSQEVVCCSYERHEGDGFHLVAMDERVEGDLLVMQLRGLYPDPKIDWFVAPGKHLISLGMVVSIADLV